MIESGRLATLFLATCGSNGILAATAESCTGGMIIASLTDIAGSSAVVDRGFITYSNEAKMEMLGVRAETLAAHGAVSEQTALEMAVGVLKHSRASIALSVTGVAGPGGGSSEKPVGLVWFGVAMRGGKPTAFSKIFEDRGRGYIRQQAVDTSLRAGLAALGVEV